MDYALQRRTRHPSDAGCDPGRASLETMASSVLSAKPIRQTSLQTESGVSSTHASLLLYAPVTDGDEAVAQARDVWRPIARFGLIVVLIGASAPP